MNNSKQKAVLCVVHRHYTMLTVKCCLECNKHKISLLFHDKDALEVEVKDFAPTKRVWGVVTPKILQKASARWEKMAPFSEDSQHLCRLSAATGTWKCFPFFPGVTKRCSYLSEHGVSDGAQVNRPFVGQVIENVECPGCFWSLLLVAKDEINPLVQLAGDKLTLQSLEGQKKEQRWRIVSVNRCRLF